MIARESIEFNKSDLDVWFSANLAKIENESNKDIKVYLSIKRKSGILILRELIGSTGWLATTLLDNGWRESAVESCSVVLGELSKRKLPKDAAVEIANFVCNHPGDQNSAVTDLIRDKILASD